jgi:hypothetical protein
MNRKAPGRFCPLCNHPDLRPSRARSWLEVLGMFVLLRPWRCHDCGYRTLRFG